MPKRRTPRQSGVNGGLQARCDRSLAVFRRSHGQLRIALRLLQRKPHVNLNGALRLREPTRVLGHQMKPMLLNAREEQHGLLVGHLGVEMPRPFAVDVIAIGRSKERVRVTAVTDQLFQQVQNVLS